MKIRVMIPGKYEKIDDWAPTHRTAKRTRCLHCNCSGQLQRCNHGEDIYLQRLDIEDIYLQRLDIVAK
jgi:hypothetical protein